ncbi:MAG: hypothetical protein M3P85_11120 [Actinomycetota bacterium]|nr:hypothetical protein [Actinomycetota bacterium]
MAATDPSYGFDAKFAALTRSLHTEARAIDADNDLTLQAKQRDLNAVAERGQQRLDELMREERDAIGREYETARAAIGMGAISTGGGEAERASHRAALDRALAAKSSREVSNLMARGVAEGDRALEHAGFLAALARASERIEENKEPKVWGELVREYAARHPVVDKNLARFAAAAEREHWLRKRRNMDPARSAGFLVPKLKATPPKTEEARYSRRMTA